MGTEMLCSGYNVVRSTGQGLMLAFGTLHCYFRQFEVPKITYRHADEDCASPIAPKVEALSIVRFKHVLR